MKPILLLASIATVGFAHAERLLDTPTAMPLGAQTLRYEIQFEGSKLDRYRAFLGVGIGDRMELDGVLMRERGRDSATGTVDFSYVVLKPVADFGPGIALGVQDIFDQTEFGLSVWGAVTFRINNYGILNSDVPTDLTLGGGTGRYRGMFVSLRFPLTNQIRLLAEHDSRELGSGIEVALQGGIRARVTFRERETRIGLIGSIRF